jgi:hypothetical protein
LGNLSRVDIMTAFRCHFRLPSTVLAAIVGILSVAGEASACSTMNRGKATRSCCAGLSRSACCCEAETAETRPESPDSQAVGMTADGGRLLAPGSPCECRVGDPTESAPQPKSASSRHRIDRDGVRSVELNVDIRPAIARAPVGLATETPPRTPLYLRTSRLLI